MTNPQMMPDHHLTDETLAAFADGRLRGKERQAVIEHLSTCGEDCRDDLAAISEAKELGVIEDEGNVVRGNFVRRAVLAAAAAAAVVMILPVPRVQEWIRFQRTGGVSELVAASATLERRATEARLSGGFPYQEPPPTYRSGEGSKDVSPNMQLAAYRVVEKGNNHGKGLAYLHLNEREAAIAALEEAVKSSPKNALLLSDLAAAYLDRARYGGGEAYRPKAVEASRRAWSMKQTPEIAWNRALALEKNGDPSAKQAWEDYLKLDPSSPWAEEVQTRHRTD